jgi:PAS domain S-box-containing protein
MESIVEHIPHMIFVKDGQDLRFVRFNKAGEELLGYSRDDLIGCNDYDFFPKEEADFFTQKDRAVLAAHGVVDIPEEPIQTREKGLRYLHTKKIPIFDENGNAQYLLGISEDITDAKQIASELRDAKEAAEAASQAKSDFLARISHEIRTPMNAIMGMTELALDTELSADQKEYIESVRQSSSHLLRIINDILDFSRVDAGVLSLVPVTFDLFEVVEEAARSAEAMLGARPITLEMDLSEDLPRHVVTDPDRLRQVLLNLLGNAVRFTARGEIELRAFSGAKDGEIEFTVRDTGIGIPKQVQANIFEAFSQSPDSAAAGGGTGLGLAISARLVELMGGRIWVNSEVGAGSTFHFTVRVLPAEEGVRGLEDDQAAAIELPPLRVLLAEDHAVNRALAVRLLENAGHDVVVARDGREAVAMFQRHPVDLVLMDVRMPELDGLEATRAIRDLEAGSGAHTPVIALTAHAMRGDRERCLDAGMDGYVAKPISRAALFKAIAVVIGDGHPGRLQRGAAVPMSSPGDPLESQRAFFLQSSRDEVVAIEDALSRGDCEEAARLAHGLAGSTGFFKEQEASARARELMGIAESGDVDQARRCLESLSRAVQAME